MDDYTMLLAKELQKAESSLAVKKGRTLKTETYKSFVKDMADGFVRSMEKTANERMQSDLKRLAVEKEKQQAQDFEKTFNGQVSGDLEAFVHDGALILDENQLQRTNNKPYKGSSYEKD